MTCKDQSERIEALEKAVSAMALQISMEHGANVAARNAVAAMLSALSGQPQVLTTVAQQLERAYAQALGGAENEPYLDAFKKYADLISLFCQRESEPKEIDKSQN